MDGGTVNESEKAVQAAFDRFHTDFEAMHFDSTVPVPEVPDEARQAVQESMDRRN